MITALNQTSVEAVKIARLCFHRDGRSGHITTDHQILYSVRLMVMREAVRRS